MPAKDAPGAGTLYIAAQGADSARLVGKVRRLIGKAPVLEKPEESLELGGAIVARRALESTFEGKVRSVDGRIVAAQPYAAFWSGRREEGGPEMPENRDRDALQTGVLISGFIENLVHGKFVVAIISEKYLRSPYCMYELES